MATKTLGTNANNSLTAQGPATNSMAGFLDADIATIAANIKDDVLGAFSRIVPGAWSRGNLLVVPNRGILKVLPGDWVAVDTNSGWPILVSGNVIGRAGTPWHHS
jgi:hypothetical protein